VPAGWTTFSVPGDPRTFVLPPSAAATPGAAATGAGAPGVDPSGLRQPYPPPFTPAVGVPGGRRTGRLKVFGQVFGAVTGSALVLGVAVVSALLVAALSVSRWYGINHLGITVELALTAFLTTGGHAVVTLWAVRKRPVRPWAIAVTQVPFLAAYAVGIAWYYSRDAGIHRTGFPPLFALWAAAALSALAWLIIWYAQNLQRARRAIVFLCAVAVLIVINGGGLFTLTWRHTNGLGLIGPPTPWEAVEDVAATSCISNQDFYNFGDEFRQANCPTGPNADFYAGQHDEAAFGQLLCNGQPREAFQVWWDRSRRYQVAITLDFKYPSDWKSSVDGKPVAKPLPGRIGGDKATVSVTVDLQSAFHLSGVNAEDTYPMRVDKSSETWNVQLEHQSLGGWKVCRIDVPDPIQDHPAPAASATGPTAPDTDDPLGRLRSQLPCGPMDPFRQYHSCPSDSPTPTDSPSGEPSPTPAPSTP
jgi:hypothetical protein